MVGKSDCIVWNMFFCRVGHLNSYPDIAYQHLDRIKYVLLIQLLVLK